MEKIIPHHKYFDTQKEGEDVLLITRRHWIVYLPPFIIGTLVLIFCIVFYSQMDKVNVIENNESIQAITTVTLSIFMLFTILFVYISWLVHYLNFQLVTNQNLVDVDQHSLFSRQISELNLEDIQDVSATQHGIMQSIFHYGDIIVQTAGEKMNFTCEKIKDPYDNARKIMEIKEKYGKEEVNISHSGPKDKEINEI